MFKSICHGWPIGRHSADALMNGVPVLSDLTRRCSTLRPASVNGNLLPNMSVVI